MAYMRSVTFVLLINLCIILCASLPLSSIQREEKDNFYNKVFPGEERASQDYFDRYPWSRNKQTESFPSRDRAYDNENTASKFQLQRSLTDEELKRTLLRDIANWKNGNNFEKREPQRKCRIHPGYIGCSRQQTQNEDEARNKDMEPFNRDPGANLSDEEDKDRIKQYDEEIERTFRALEREMDGRKLL